MTRRLALLLVSLAAIGCTTLAEPGAQPTTQIVYVTPAPTPRIVYVTPAPTVKVVALPTIVPVVDVGTPYMTFLTWGSTTLKGIKTDTQLIIDGDIAEGAASGTIDTNNAITWLVNHPPMACYAIAHAATYTEMIDLNAAFIAAGVMAPDAVDKIHKATASMQAATAALDTMTCI